MADRLLTLAATLVLVIAAPLSAPYAQQQHAQQQPAQQPAESVQDGEAIVTPDVEESGVENVPDEQGIRPPEAVEAEDEVDLYRLLQALRSAPPDLEGQPVPRPNLLASEPETEMAPAQPRDAYLFPDDYIE